MLLCLGFKLDVEPGMRGSRFIDLCFCHLRAAQKAARVFGGSVLSVRPFAEGDVTERYGIRLEPDQCVLLIPPAAASLLHFCFTSKLQDHRREWRVVFKTGRTGKLS